MWEKERILWGPNTGREHLWEPPGLPESLASEQEFSQHRSPPDLPDGLKQPSGEAMLGVPIQVFAAPQRHEKV